MVPCTYSMPKAADYAKQKAKGGAEWMKRESLRACKYAKDNRDAFNARRRQNLKHQIFRIKIQAKRRGYTFELDDDDMRAMLGAACTYCGTEANPFNTIDRLDNTKGYAANNVVTCCKTCNMTKGCLDPNTYVERCKHIAFIHTGEGELHEDSWASTKPESVTLAIYQRSARKKGLEFALGEDEFKQITGECCVYCRQPTTKTHKNGIDRIDCNQGYITSNCVTCCGQCNIAKKKLTYDEFIAHACKVSSTCHIMFGDVPRCKRIITPRKICNISD